MRILMPNPVSVRTPRLPIGDLRGKIDCCRVQRRKRCWFDLPVMMKLTLSTPHHALKNLAKGPLTRPNNFMMIPQIQRFGYPQDVNSNKCTLITSFSSDRDHWMRAKCINIHDTQSRVYELHDEYDARRAVPMNFSMLLESYQNHPEAKSLGPKRQSVRIRHARIAAASSHRCKLAASLHRQGIRQALGGRRRFEFAGVQDDPIQAKGLRHSN